MDKFLQVAEPRPLPADCTQCYNPAVMHLSVELVTVVPCLAGAD